MNETMVCAVGNVATQPVFREAPTGPSARFRIAVTARHWDREKSLWVDGHTSFYTVWAGRRLAANASASLSVGDPVIVQGRLKVRSEMRDGQQAWTSADIDAVAIGHDLARGTSAFRRASRPEPGTGAGAGAGAVTAAAPAGAASTWAEPNWETPPGGSPDDAQQDGPTAAPPFGAPEGPPPGSPFAAQEGPPSGPSFGTRPDSPAGAPAYSPADAPADSPVNPPIGTPDASAKPAQRKRRDPVPAG